MAPIMEGRHTVLLLYAPIHELSNISLYFPKRRAPSYHYKNRAPHADRARNDHGPANDDLAGPRQRGQSSLSSDSLLDSQRATKGAVAELCWLAAEHRQLLADLLSLCKVCAKNLRMGNQDGKLQEYVEGQEAHFGSQALSGAYPHAVAPENRRNAPKNKRPKKLGGKKLEGIEDFSQSKVKKKVMSEASSAQHLRNNSNPIVESNLARRTQGIQPLTHVSDASVTGSYMDALNEPILPMDEPFQISKESWDFMEDNRPFDPDMDFCNDFSEYDGELGYGSSFCSLMEGLSRRESGSNLRPVKRPDSSAEGKPAQQVLGEQSSAGVRVVAKVQEVEGRVQHVSHTSPERGGTAMVHSGTWKRQSNKLPEGLSLPLSHTNEPYPQTKLHARSPPSPSLAGVFNTSFPASNSLQSMSPMLSPLSSKQTSPRLNHRILVLSDKDADHEQDSSGNVDEPRLFSEVVDRNGNKRTLTRLDLNLGRRPSNAKWNSTRNSTTTGELRVLPPQPC